MQTPDVVPLADALAHWHDFYILLGTASATVPTGVVASSPSSGTTSAAAPSPSATSSAPAANDGQSGGSITVKTNAPYGIPCVD